MSTIIFTIDVEDWFQVENFKQWIPFSSWPSCELRVEKNVHRLLDLMDTYNGISATFFILGWIAERLPHLVREIHNRGHEVASHGYNHELCNLQSYKELKKDLSNSKKLLEDIIGFPVIGYRAPSFSVNNEALKLIEECGYQYDSSFNSFAMHGRYGQIPLSKYKKQGIAVELSKNFYELPLSNFKIGNIVLPLGGGGYFRLIPFPFFKMGVKSILTSEKTYVFYMHPWEIDPEQPRVNQASSMYKFRHYVNIKKCKTKLDMFFKTFNRCNLISCSKYLKKL
ncbi:Polysaccharide deacetylase [Candidatus Magnetomoraceae bacterium gMMP-1]